MLFCMGARARAVDEILVDNITLFSYLMMTISAHFTYMESWMPLEIALSVCCLLISLCILNARVEKES
jgi:hypothetical protein